MAWQVAIHFGEKGCYLDINCMYAPCCAIHVLENRGSPQSSIQNCYQLRFMKAFRINLGKDSCPWFRVGFSFKILSLIRVKILVICIRMSNWHHKIVEGAKFWIIYQQLRLLSVFIRWQLIQNLAPSTILWRHCDIKIDWKHFAVRKFESDYAMLPICTNFKSQGLQRKTNADCIFITPF